MKPEMLETLLLDRSFGELSPETAALLDEHLARDPAAARAATALSDTLRLARTAVRPRSVPPPPPLDLARLRHTAYAEAAPRRRGEWLRLAACLAVGLGVGWLARPLVPASAETATLAPALRDVARPSRDLSSAGLWSRSRLAAEYATAAARTPRDGAPAGSPYAPNPSAPEENL